MSAAAMRLGRLCTEMIGVFARLAAPRGHDGSLGNRICCPDVGILRYGMIVAARRYIAQSAMVR